MSVKESEALVIKSYNLSDADKIVVFFTRSFGLVRGVAKGAKRLNSRYGSTLEPFSSVNLTYFQKEERELVSIQQVELTKSRFEIASDPMFLAVFSYIGELLTDFSPPHETDETLYRMLSACLSAATEEKDLRALRGYFELWLVRLSGYLPDWSKCSSCGRELGDGEAAMLVTGFQLQCDNCRKAYSIGRISSDDRQLFYAIQKLAPVDFIAFAEGRSDSLSEISGVMRRIIAQVLGREVASEAALR